MGIYQSTAISVQRKVKAMPYICLLLALQVALQSPVVFSSKTGQIAHTSEHTTYSMHPPHGNPPKRHAIIGFFVNYVLTLTKNADYMYTGHTRSLN